MAEALRKGIVEEDVNRNLDAAVQNYQSVVAQYDEDRKSAATALFRLAECYRKQGKNDQATAAYKRVVQEFADQTKLAEQSRSHLPKTAADAARDADRAQYLEAVRANNDRVASARQRVRAVLEERLKNAQDDLVKAEAAGKQIPALRDGVTARRIQANSFNAQADQVTQKDPSQAEVFRQRREDLMGALQKSQEDLAAAQTLASRIPEMRERILDLRQQLAAFDLETAQRETTPQP
jgi:tetratricopeptide (TPR) repeat protein